jgi:acyl transferase domain-containing protein
LPLIMITEYALAQLWMSWGVTPAALVGHSMGENTAACVAGVMSFEDCIGLVHLRGTLFDTVPPGGMLSVAAVGRGLRAPIWATISTWARSTRRASDGGVRARRPRWTRWNRPSEARRGGTQRIQIDIAAHSRMLEPILDDFGDYLRSIDLHAAASR